MTLLTLLTSCKSLIRDSTDVDGATWPNISNFQKTVQWDECLSIYSRKLFTSFNRKRQCKCPIPLQGPNTIYVVNTSGAPGVLHPACVAPIEA